MSPDMKRLQQVVALFSDKVVLFFVRDYFVWQLGPLFFSKNAG